MHLLHPVAPELFENVPMEQGTHSVLASVGEKRPGKHVEQILLPATAL
tara:strand:+ start:4847 stop:4990 length:144 start_codon:yes stop_codon:yes gene_type:complete